MSETTPADPVPPDGRPAPDALVALRTYPGPEAADVALALLGASGVRGLLLRQQDGSAVVAVHARDEAAAERVLASGMQRGT
jgi:hypothetical protein